MKYRRHELGGTDPAYQQLHQMTWNSVSCSVVAAASAAAGEWVDEHVQCLRCVRPGLRYTDVYLRVWSGRRARWFY